MGVSVVEVEPELAERAGRVIEKLGLEGDVRVINGDETAIRDLEFDIVLVAALAEPKERVFRNIHRYVDGDTRVIYRTYTGMRAILYSPVGDEDVRGF